MISGNDKRKERHLQSKIDKLIVERDNISKFPKHQLSLETMDLFKENKQAIQNQLSRDNFEDSPKQNQMLSKKK